MHFLLGNNGSWQRTVHFLAGQKKLEDKHKDPDVLPKINNSDIEGMIESIKEYLWSHHGVIRAPLAYLIQKTITVHTYCDHPMYATQDGKMIVRMLHLPPDKNRCLSEKDAKTALAHQAKYEIDNWMVYDILDQICIDTDFFPYVKQH